MPTETTEQTAPTDVQLGERYTDRITGFTGVASAKAIYLHDADEVLVETLSPDGARLAEWFEYTRVQPATD